MSMNLTRTAGVITIQNSTNRGVATVIRKTEQEAMAYYMESPVFNAKRSPSNRSDFGDRETVGLNVRRVGFSDLLPKEFPMDHSFGVFAGQHGDEWVVVTKRFDYSGVSGAEVFPDLASLKQRWELD